MNPFYFGTQHRRLFGLYQPPAFGSTGQRAAVLCYPFGDEYIYAHRAVRQLAARLSAAGFHTLRFDYFGTGDSAGDMTGADLSGWESDLELAIDELINTAGVPQVALIGVRLGAAIAARVAARMPSSIAALALWDPVVSGQDYARGLGAALHRNAATADTLPTYDVGAFRVTQSMLEEIRAIDLVPVLSAPPVRTLVVVTDPMPSHETLRHTQAAALCLEFMSAPLPWIETVATAGIVPVSLLQRIADWLA